MKIKVLNSVQNGTTGTLKYIKKAKCRDFYCLEKMIVCVFDFFSSFLLLT